MTVDVKIVFETRGRKKKYTDEERKEVNRLNKLKWQQNNKDKYNKYQRECYHKRKNPIPTQIIFVD